MIVLDTHAWVWWVSDPDRVSGPARLAIEQARGVGALLASSISAWEVAMLAARGRLELTIPVEEWIARCEAVPGMRFVPVNNAIALRSVNLPGTLHPDPADRIIVATALEKKARLITKDARLQAYPHVQTLW